MWSMTPVKEALSKPAVLAGVASVVSGTVGAILGYRVAQSRLKTHYENLANEEIEQAKSLYGAVYKSRPDGSNITVEEFARDRLGENALDAIKTYSGSKQDLEQSQTTVTEQISVKRVKTQNVFEEPVEIVAYEGWDYQVELSRRSGERPYIITEDEYMNCERDYKQISLTYYEGDDVLVDDEEDVVTDSEGLVGDDNLMRFGHGCKQKNELFIRNEQLEVEFEIVKSENSYAVEVLGFDPYETNQNAGSSRRRNE